MSTTSSAHLTGARSSSKTSGAPKPTKWYRRYQWGAYLFLLPGLLFYVVFLLRPLLESVWIAFFDWDGITAAEWVGADNFKNVLQDPIVWESFAHSLLFIIFYAVVPIILALLVVLIISRFKVRGLVAFRAMLFVPYVLSTVVVAIAWRWIYTENGPINELLRAMGLDGMTRSWLGDFDTALPSVGVIGTWVMFGLAFILLIAGLQNIAPELYEAARLDGANAWQEFFAVTLPALRGELQVAAILTITAALRNFDIVWNTTAGGPGTSTTVPSYFIYREAFITHHVGRASAVAVLLTIIIFLTVGVIMRITTEKDAPSKPKRSARAKSSSRIRTAK